MSAGNAVGSLGDSLGLQTLAVGGIAAAGAGTAALYARKFGDSPSASALAVGGEVAAKGAAALAIGHCFGGGIAYAIAGGLIAAL